MYSSSNIRIRIEISCKQIRSRVSRALCVRPLDPEWPAFIQLITLFKFDIDFCFGKIKYKNPRWPIFYNLIVSIES